MRLSVLLLLLLSLAMAQAQWQWLRNLGENVRDVARFPKQAAQGSLDMYRAYRDMREANYKGGDKYFHARGNYDAASRGSGGRWAAKTISDGRELFKKILGRERGDIEADREADEWGRSSKDPNHFRSNGLPKEY